MNIPMTTRMRGSGGRFPQALQQPAGRMTREAPAERPHPKAGGRARRTIANTRRGASGGKALSTRGRKHVITRDSGGRHGAKK